MGKLSVIVSDSISQAKYPRQKISIPKNRKIVPPARVERTFSVNSELLTIGRYKILKKSAVEIIF